MVSKQVGAIFVIFGGVFYILGSFLGVFLTAAFSGFAYGLSGVYVQNPAAAPYGASALVLLVLGFGIFSGVLIIVGGALLNSDSPEHRKAGGILALAMMILGAIPAFGGAIIGFFFTLLGSIIGLTYKGEPNLVVGMMTGPPLTPSLSGRVAPVKFCIKCGLQLYQGTLYCGSCGAPVPQG